MSPITLDYLTDRLELADQLYAGRENMSKPQDLPGRYGRVVRAVDQLLNAADIPAVVGGGWAVWHHGYVGRVTEDVDIALPADRVEEFLRMASVSGFELLPQKPGRWPKVIHKESKVKVDIMPEGARPGTQANPAPTTIPHPTKMGAVGTELVYIKLASLIELKLAAGRDRDRTDVVEILRVQEDQTTSIREHLQAIHPAYVEAFEKCVQSAQTQEDK